MAGIKTDLNRGALCIFTRNKEEELHMIEETGHGKILCHIERAPHLIEQAKGVPVKNLDVFPSHLEMWFSLGCRWVYEVVEGRECRPLEETISIIEYKTWRVVQTIPMPERWKSIYMQADTREIEQVIEWYCRLLLRQQVPQVEPAK